MGSLKFDLLDAVRGLRRDGVYGLTVVMTLAVTIGATTAVFSIVKRALLEPLAYRESQRLVALREIWRRPGERAAPFEVNERHFNYWREHARSFAAMAQYTARPANLTGAGEAARITVARTSGSLFDVLQVQAAIGRTLTQDDEPAERPDVTGISDSPWRQRFSADRSTVGRSIAIEGKPYTVVGVLPAGFQVPDRARLTTAVDAFIPLRVDVGWVGDHNNDAIGRL